MVRTASAFVLHIATLPSLFHRAPPPSLAAARPSGALWHAKRLRAPAARMCAGSGGKGDRADDAGDDDDVAGEPLRSVEGRDWREFRAALVAGSSEELEKKKQNAYRAGHWAHPLATPETGCFLASHPAYYRRSAIYLTQAVVFVTSFSATKGATGVVLNRPLRGTIAELEKDGLFGRSSNLAATSMGAQPVYLGGPDLVDSGVMTVLHGKEMADVGDVQQPLDGVYVGGMDHFMKGLEAGEAEPGDARVFSGCIKWGVGKLEREVDEGSWYCVSASPLYALKHCIQLPKPLWVEIMQSQGMPFAQIASQVYDEDAEPEKKDDA